MEEAVGGEMMSGLRAGNLGLWKHSDNNSYNSGVGCVGDKQHFHDTAFFFFWSERANSF